MKKIFLSISILLFFVQLFGTELIIREWLVLQPIQSNSTQLLLRPYLPEEKMFPQEAEKFGDKEWKRVSVNKNMNLDFLQLFGLNENSQNMVVYSCAYVNSDKETTALLKVHSDDGVLIWHNGLKIWQNNAQRGINDAGDRVNVHLQKGMNCFLFKVTQLGGGWGLSCSIESELALSTAASVFIANQLMPANNKKLWIPETRFEIVDNKTISTTISLLNSGKENLKNVSCYFANESEILVEKNISELPFDVNYSIKLQSTIKTITTILSSPFPCLKVRVNNEILSFPIHPKECFDAALEIGIVSKEKAISDASKSLKGVIMILGYPANLTNETQSLTNAIRDGKTDIHLAELNRINHLISKNMPDFSDRNIHVVGHAHIDMNWLWPFAETKKIMHDNLRQTVTFMEEIPDFTMIQSQAAIYNEIEKTDPVLFNKIKKYVAEGRLEIGGGMWTEGDANLSGGEALARSLLLGQQYYLSRFGKTSIVGWLPDNFGHASQIPQLFNLSGIKYFYLHRCNPYLGTYWWIGPDSSKLLCYSNKTYNGKIEPSILSNIREFSPEKKRILAITGVGDHGGGPTREDINTIRVMQSIPNYAKIKFSTAQEFFQQSSMEMDGRPSHFGEMQYIFEGCYTSIAEIKEGMRKSEQSLYAAEMLSSIQWMKGKPYPSATLKNMWETVTFNQFHDILPGSAISQSNKEAIAELWMVQKNALDIRDNNFRSLSDEIKFKTEYGQPIVAMNMRAYGKKMLVEAEFFSHEKPATVNPLSWGAYSDVFNQIVINNIGQGNVPTILLYDANGNTIPAQIVWSKIFPPGYRSRVLFVVDQMPAAGYKTFYINPSKAGEQNNLMPFKGFEFETEYLTIAFDRKTGDIRRLFDKRSNTEYAIEGNNLNQLKVYMERPNGMNAWTIGEIADVIPINDVREVKLCEQGPVRSCVQAIKYFGQSKIIQRIYVYHSYPRVDIDLEVHWFERGSDTSLSPFLKAVFPLAIKNAQFNCHVPFDVVSRSENGQEVPAQQWVDISDGNKGMALLNQTKFGHSYQNGELMLSLLRSTYAPASYASIGVHHIQYALFPHPDDWRNGVWQEAEDFNIPVYAAEPPSLSQGKLSATQKEEASFINIQPNNISLSGIKQSEEGKEVILRFVEIEGKETIASIQLPIKIKDVRRLNIIEQDLENANKANFSGNSITVTVKAHEIVTLGVKF